MADAEKLIVRRGEGFRFDGLGVEITRLVHPVTVGSKDICVAHCVFEPGQSTQRHYHANEEAFYILEGEATMYIDGVGEFRISEGDCAFAPPNRIHGFVNDSPSVMRVLTALSPPPGDDYPITLVDD